MEILFFYRLKKACYIFISSLLTILFLSCNQKSKNEDNQAKTYPIGSYGHDVSFFKQNKIKIIELKDTISNASILIVPDYQGRVMTSTANGYEDISFGWINYNLIKSGVISKQFNPFGGEERLWLGPEGGPFSIYFKGGDEQVFSNWKVPKELDNEAFDIVDYNSQNISFKKDFTLTNYSETELKIGIERKIKLFSRQEIENTLNLVIDKSLKCVAYQSENTLINNGAVDWNKQTGFLSIWMLSMFNPSSGVTVFIPFKKSAETKTGKIVNDDYFGKVPSDRLIVKDSILFFKTDGKLRSKIGLSPQHALPYCGSYDKNKKVLTVLWYSKPDKLAEYVNSKWGKQDNPLNGDAMNSYNDGPADDGKTMGPFYEIESSSPAAILKAGSKFTHTQRIYHFMGNEDELNNITEALFHVSIAEIQEVFK